MRWTENAVEEGGRGWSEVGGGVRNGPFGGPGGSLRNGLALAPEVREWGVRRAEGQGGGPGAPPEAKAVGARHRGQNGCLLGP